MNVFIALKGTQFLNFICVCLVVRLACGGLIRVGPKLGRGIKPGWAGY